MSARSSSAPSDVAIVTVSYNSSAQLEDFLSHATASVARAQHVVVVDNASADVAITQKLVDRFGARLIRLDTNVGYGQAANAGSAALDHDVPLVLVCNPDAIVSAAAVTALRDTLMGDATIGSVGPRIRDADGVVYPSARAIPSIRTGAGHAIFARIWPGNPWTKRYYSDAYRSDVQTDAGWLSGACVMVRREVFDRLGGFSPAYFMYFEDVDLGYRLGQAGLRNVFVPAAEVTHVGGVTTKASKPLMLRAHHDSAKRFLATKYHGWIWAPVRLVLSVGLNVRLWYETRQLT